jgi:beta-xylosidase
MHKFFLIIINLILLLFNDNSYSQNPIISNQYTADPSARVFGDSVYVYPSHDIAGIEGKGRKNWFCMEDYHVFSSANLTNWIDHGVIVSQYNVNWVDSNLFSFWAPDCISKKGKYYFYFPALPKDTTYGKRFSIGVAISDNPFGPFTPQKEAIGNVKGIDPNLFTDKDGEVYLYWAMRKIYVAKLKENMLELATEPQIVQGLPEIGLKEGPYLFERNGVYYMTYPHVENKIERLEYAMSDNPVGPFRYSGVIMDESPMGCWTNHQSVIQFKDQWYLFYHENDLSPKFDKNRSVRIDSLFFNTDGTIQRVTPTFRGVGITNASQKIEIDRYSKKSDSTVSVAFMDTLNTFKGWKVALVRKNSWIQYNAVEFENENLGTVRIKTFSNKESTLNIRMDNIDGTLLAEIKIPGGARWNIIDVPLIKCHPGTHNLFIILNENSPVEIDWLQFIK